MEKEEKKTLGSEITNSDWHTKTSEQLIKEFHSHERGLLYSEAEQRLKEHGLNKLPEGKKTPVWITFLKQFNSPLIYILIIAMIISFSFHHTVDGYVILAVLILNACIGFFQERKAEKSIDALKKIIVSYAKVYRNGNLIKIPSEQLVPGDIISLEEGDKVPADCRVIEIKNLRTQESSLTGESFPVDKNIKSLEQHTALGDRTNIVFMSTIVVGGTATAIVVATGSETEIGKIASSIQEVKKEKSYFKKKTTHLATLMATFAIIGSSLVFLIGLFVNKLSFMEIFFFTIAALVSGIPEGLPAILSIVLAVGAWRMAKRNAIIRHLPSVETLGVATVIVTDKTGTLTRNSMTVEKIITSEGEFSVSGNGWQPIGRFSQKEKIINATQIDSLKKIFSISTLCNKSQILRKDGKYEIIGDPTEAALLVLSKKAGFEKENLEKQGDKLIDDLPFSSLTKLRASMVEVEKNKIQIYTIGAFEEVIKKTTHILDSGKKKLEDKSKNELLKKAESLAKEGYRVLALAYKESTSSTKSISEEMVRDLILVGIVGMKDPPRPEVKEAIEKANSAGIRIIMNTGDHKATATAIAQEIGLIKSSQISSKTVLDQSELEKLSKEEFEEVVKEAIIFARVTPKMKLKIVAELQRQGHIVAMTGDGVNDAPALKKADIGIAMGIIGTDVARESSEMVLADDNFATIVNAIEEGRVVFRNIRSTSTYLVTTNVAEHITIVTSLIMQLPLPLIPIHILWMNLVTDGFNGFSLAIEPSHNTALEQKPRKKKEKILNMESLPYLFIVSLPMAIGTIYYFTHFLQIADITKAMTAAFVMMTSCQLFSVINMRSLHKSAFKIGFFKNKYILLSLILSLIGMLSVIYLPFLNQIFRFEPLSMKELFMIMASSSIVFISAEIYKFARYRNRVDV